MPVVPATAANVPAAAELAPITVPSIAPPLMSTFPEVNDVFAVSTVNVPAAGLVPPTTMLSSVPPSKLAALIVPRFVTVAPAKFTVPLAVRLVNVPAAAELAPIVAPSKAPPFKSTVVATRLVNVPAAGVAPPITVASIEPPLISTPAKTDVPVNVGPARSALVAIAVTMLSNSVSNSVPRITLLVSPPGSVSLAAKSVIFV